jgi:hypothetical protein
MRPAYSYRFAVLMLCKKELQSCFHHFFLICSSDRFCVPAMLYRKGDDLVHIFLLFFFCCVCRDNIRAGLQNGMEGESEGSGSCIHGERMCYIVLYLNY